MPWIKEEKLYPIIALLLILIIAVRTPLETDMWWHLRAGEETVLNGKVYAVDTFSFTREGADWVNHSWLSQVVMFLVFQASSYRGLSVWVAVCAVLSMVFIYPRMKGHPLWRSSVLVFAAVVSSVVWSPRPQIHTLVLFSLLGYLLFEFKKTKNMKYLFWCLPIFVLWGNLHGGYVLGIILLATIIVGEILNILLFKNSTDKLSWRQIGSLAVLMIASLLMVLINPFGIEMWRIPFKTVSVETLQNLIDEWASPDFHQAFQQPMLWMLLGVFSLIGLSTKSIDGTELIPLVAFSWAALVARRNFGPFALIAAPIFSKYMASFIEDWLNIAKQRVSWVRRILDTSIRSNQDLKPGLKNLINLMLIGLLLAGAVWKVYDVSARDFVQEAEKDIYPVAAVEYMEEAGIRGNMFNDYNWGGYLIWHLRDVPVFVDGRTDLFAEEILDDYVSVISGKQEWSIFLEKYEIDILLVRPDLLPANIIENERLAIRFEDDGAVILTK